MLKIIITNLNYIVFFFIFFFFEHSEKLSTAMFGFILFDIIVTAFKTLHKNLSIFAIFRKIVFWISMIFGIASNNLLFMKIAFVLYYGLAVFFTFFYTLKKYNFPLIYAREYILNNIDNLSESEKKFINKKYLLNQTLFLLFSIAYIYLGDQTYVICLYTFNILLHIFVVLTYAHQYKLLFGSLNQK